MKFSICRYVAVFSFVLASCSNRELSPRTNGQELPLFDEVVSTWHNIQLAYDVNGNGTVTAIDILNVINAINRDGEHRLHEASYQDTMYHYDVNFDGYVTIIDAELVVRELNQIFIEERDPQSHSPYTSLRQYQLGFDTAKLFYRLCPIRPVAQINGASPQYGERWFETIEADASGKRVYFSVETDGDFVRLAEGSTENRDKYIAKLPMELFDETDDPFTEPWVSILSSDPYGCPKTPD